jgi:hypothetical protein
VLDDGAGSVVFIEWEDTQLRTACVFQTAADGAIRCLPSVRQPLTHYFTDTVYTDADCKGASLALAEGVPPPDYALESLTARQPCEAQRFVVKARGSAIEQLDTVYHRSTVDGTCAAIAAGLPPDTALYALGDEVPPGVFLRAERSPGDRGSRLKPLELRGDDGSFARDGIWDDQRSEECSRQVPDGRWCVPQAAWIDASFSDAGCTMQVALPPAELPRGDQTCRVFGIGAKEAGFDSCGVAREPQLYALGRPSSGRAFVSDGIACGGQDKDQDYYPIIAPLSEGALGRFETRFLGPGRLRIEALLAEDGTRLDFAEHVPRLQDAQLGIPCTAALGCDGSVLCKPLGAANSFLDDQCEIPAFVSSVPANCSDEQPMYVAPPISSDSCWQVDMLELGDILASDGYYIRNNGSCLRQSSPTDGRALRALAPTPVGSTLVTLLDRVE